MKKKLVVSMALLLFLISLVYFINRDVVVTNSTQRILVESKDKNLEEQWIVLANGRQVFIEEFSIWALIEENETYTIVYDLMKKSGKYKLRTIVPGDYQGQF